METETFKEEVKYNNEEKCKNVFCMHLARRGINIDKCENMSEKRLDPPDYYISISNTRYAVEITSTEFKRPSIIDCAIISDKNYMESAERFIKEIEEETIFNNILKGLYIVYFNAPIAGRNQYSNVKRELKIKLISLIQETETVPSFVRARIEVNGKIVCYVSKILSSEYTGTIKLLECGFSRTAWPHSPEVINQLTEQIQYAIDIKEEKLKNITGHKILIIQDSFLLADTYSFQQATNKIDKRSFELITIIYDNDSLHFTNDIEQFVGTFSNHL